MTTPKYYYAVFGEPNPPEKDEVESGIYHPDPHQAPFLVKPGDLLLLYCAGKYEAHPMEVPGIGVALRIDDVVVEYRYLPFAKPIPRDQLIKCLEKPDLANFCLIYLKPFWMHEISRNSFVAAVGNASIVWP